MGADFAMIGAESLSSRLSATPKRSKAVNAGLSRWRCASIQPHRPASTYLRPRPPLPPHLSSNNAPKTGLNPLKTKPRLWEFAIKYMDRSSSLGVEIAFVWWGPTFVMLCFAAVAALARLWGYAACGGKGGGGGEGASLLFCPFGPAVAVLVTGE